MKPFYRTLLGVLGLVLFATQVLAPAVCAQTTACPAVACVRSEPPADPAPTAAGGCAPGACLCCAPRLPATTHLFSGSPVQLCLAPSPASGLSGPPAGPLPPVPIATA